MKHSSVLVTGASRGIGAAVAAHLRAEGINAVTPSRAQLDLNSPDSVSQFLESLAEPISGLVLNAAVNHPMTFADWRESAWSEMLQTNMLSALQLLQTLVPAMADRNFGRVVALSSLYSGRARSGRVAYSASKAALEAMIRSVALEYASKNVIANCVAPGFVDTDLTRRNNDSQTLDRIVSEIPVARLARPDEIARTIAFLIAPANEYITGQTLVVDGGVSCR